MAFVGILPQVKLLLGPLVIQLGWYILKQLFTSVSVKVMNIYVARQISTTIHLHYNYICYLYFSRNIKQRRVGTTKKEFLVDDTHAPLVRNLEQIAPWYKRHVMLNTPHRMQVLACTLKLLFD